MHTFNFDQLLKHIDDPYVVASHIKQAYHKAANAITKDRAWNLSHAIDDVLSDYRDYLLAAAFKTGKARYITPGEAKGIHPIHKADKGADPRGVIYISNPQGIRIPELYGARSRSIILSGDYAPTDYLKSTLRYWNHNTLYGWEDGKPVKINGYYRPHMSDKRKIREYMKACKWYASLKEGTIARNAPSFTLDAFVDFSDGNSFPVGTFRSDLSENGKKVMRRYGDAPRRYLALESKSGKYNGLKTEATFISDNIAVITTLAGETPKGILTCLTITTPPAFTLIGNTFTIETIEAVEGGDDPHAATITFQAN